MANLMRKYLVLDGFYFVMSCYLVGENPIHNLIFELCLLDT